MRQIDYHSIVHRSYLNKSLPANVCVYVSPVPDWRGLIKLNEADFVLDEVILLHLAEDFSCI